MLIQGATAYLGFTLNNKTGPLNLTGATIKFIFRRNEFEVAQSRVCTINDAVNGICSVILPPSDLNDSGTYYYQLKITFPDTTIMKSELVSFYVEEGLEEA
jgi:hypothetical protein